jgi:acyl-coenzyme A thioesterase PaaI-like protein
LELKIAYHRALTRESGPVRAEGTVISLGRRAAFAEGKLVMHKAGFAQVRRVLC